MGSCPNVVSLHLERLKNNIIPLLGREGNLYISLNQQKSRTANFVKSEEFIRRPTVYSELLRKTFWHLLGVELTRWHHDVTKEELAVDSNQSSGVRTSHTGFSFLYDINCRYNPIALEFYVLQQYFQSVYVYVYVYTRLPIWETLIAWHVTNNAQKIRPLYSTCRRFIN